MIGLPCKETDVRYDGDGPDGARKLCYRVLERTRRGRGGGLNKEEQEGDDESSPHDFPNCASESLSIAGRPLWELPKTAWGPLDNVCVCAGESGAVRVILRRALARSGK
ncbi:hypothetical protein NL676_016620 [Syzygium grande]|nr:hypothetical protein NL676_016620 [Syzygium grande]